eukprot:TRINITY_DN26816_c0_g2_i1.p1 TRINITY_DN26816_c0_g2~~TRINITY_DN26816_c0_g2_i1.p1  ORF type:complete len:150 (+),score=13.38 TRINITY_DN26816_c0_g2_i1:112-561(+)
MDCFRFSYLQLGIQGFRIYEKRVSCLSLCVWSKGISPTLGSVCVNPKDRSMWGTEDKSFMRHVHRVGLTWHSLVCLTHACGSRFPSKAYLKFVILKKSSVESNMLIGRRSQPTPQANGKNGAIYLFGPSYLPKSAFLWKVLRVMLMTNE